jgi:hypothetical protein
VRVRQRSPGGCGQALEVQATAQRMPGSREAPGEGCKEHARRGNPEPGAGGHCRGKMGRIVRQQPVGLALHGGEQDRDIRGVPDERARPHNVLRIREGHLCDLSDRLVLGQS